MNSFWLKSSIIPECYSLYRNRVDRSCRSRSNSCCKPDRTCPRCLFWGLRRNNWVTCEYGWGLSCREELAFSFWSKTAFSNVLMTSYPASSIKKLKWKNVSHFENKAQSQHVVFWAYDRCHHLLAASLKYKKSNLMVLPFSQTWLVSSGNATHENKIKNKKLVNWWTND